MTRKPTPEKEPQPGEKLQKVLADHGLGSRREMERWIEANRVTVGDKPAHLGQRVRADEEIRVDGKPVRSRPAASSRVIIYNKPVGLVCTRRDPEGRPTIFQQLPPAGRGRWISVGRLDVATSGLLVLTNDGALANRMMHPSTGLDREYAVRVTGHLSDEQLTMLSQGIEDDGEHLAFSDIRHYGGSGANQWYHVAITEGRNREVRRLFEHIGLQVSRLKRVRFGPVILPSRLARGHWEELSEGDVKALYRLLRLKPVAPGAARRGRRRDADSKSGKKTSVLIDYPELPPVSG